MGWPQITWIVLVSLVLGMTFMLHGQPRTDRYNVWWKLFDTLVTAGVLWAGGFFGHATAAQPPAAAQAYRSDVIRNARLDWGINAPVADFAVNTDRILTHPAKVKLTHPL